MRIFALLLSCLITISLTAQIHSAKKLMCSYAWQEGHTSIIWNFTDTGEFSAIRMWGNKKGFGFTAKKGIFRLDDSAKKLTVTFDSTYDFDSKASFTISKDIGVQVWDLVTVTETKMVISRPPLWEFEKQTMANEGKNIITTLEGEKKRRKDRKQKT